jgi:hypothetical protein
VFVYIIISKLAPEKKIEDLKFTPDLRGEISVRDTLIKKLFQRILNDRALKRAIF